MQELTPTRQRLRCIISLDQHVPSISGVYVLWTDPCCQTVQQPRPVEDWPTSKQLLGNHWRYSAGVTTWVEVTLLSLLSVTGMLL